jgi:DNA ligase-1
MLFKQFSQYLKRLESTSSRNDMTTILVELLKDLPPKEIKAGVYLSLGSLRPLYDSLDFNLAEKQLEKSLVRAFDTGIDKVKKFYEKEGDLGNVAQILADGQNGTTPELLTVYEALLAIAKDQGEGSQDRKIDALANLLVQVDGLSARFVARIVLGNLRLGFSDKTVLDALSQLVAGDKSAKKKLELVYQAMPDIGLLVEEVKMGGLAAAKVKVRLGVPLMPMLCQRIKSPAEMIKKMGRVAVEPKFDGTRVQIHFRRDGKDWQVRTFTRNLEETSPMFPELKQIGEHLKCDEAVLDCEAVGFDPKTGKILPFQVTITRKRKHGIEEAAKSVPLRFYIFDCLYLDGKAIIELTYEERRKILGQIVKKDGLFVVDDYRVTDLPEEITKWHHELVAQGLEGVVVKKIDSRYIPGRTGWLWVKMKEAEASRAKLSDTIDAIVMGYYPGRGKRAQFGVGAFLVGIPSGNEILTLAKIGTGLSDELFRELKKRLDRIVTAKMPAEYRIDKNLLPPVLVEPKLVVEVAADEVTTSPTHTAGVALRFPRLIKLRDDKSPAEATTLAEVKKL